MQVSRQAADELESPFDSDADTLPYPVGGASDQDSMAVSDSDGDDSSATEPFTEPPSQRRRTDGEFQIFVRSVCGRTFVLCSFPEDDIFFVKLQLQWASIFPLT